MTLFHATVPGTPVPQGRMRHTSRGVGYYGTRSKAHRNLLVTMFRLAARRAVNICDPVTLVIEIAGARANGDADNHAKQVLDALVDAGVLAGDSVAIVRELVVRVVDGEPRTVVTINKQEATA